ncbi:hypothetical protein [Escherichia coli]|uniref:hypothetical protein n=1 Tax=Escherichia coli TaxID=562 RepID=UPI000A19E158|nr:hypothetical protein [Escherichia coli]
MWRRLYQLHCCLFIEWVLGWAVVRYKPWHLVGVYATEGDAKSKCSELNGEYEVRYGSHCLGSDDFIFVEVS